MKFVTYSPQSVLRRIFPAFAVFFAASVALSAQTSTADSDAEKDSEDVVKLSPFLVQDDDGDGYRSDKTLVGSRTAKSVLDVSNSIAIINRQTIEDLNAVDVHSLLQVGVAGVSQNQTINDDYNIRGFRSLYSLRDGITKVAYKRNPLYDVERVEVIRGPAAMLLGNNSFLGGTVNFVTRGASHKKTGDVQLTVGENSYYRLQANVTGPLVDKNNLKLDYRLTLGYNIGDKDKEIEEEDNKFLGGALGFQFGPNTSFTLSGYYYQDDGYFYWEDFLDYSSTRGGSTLNPKWAVLNPYSTKEFSPGRGKDALWNNKDIFINATFLTKITDNTNFRLAFYVSKDIDERRHVRGISIASDNVTLNRQDIPLRIDANTKDWQADITNTLELPAGMKLDTTVGADYILQYTLQAQVVATPPSINVTSSNPFAADDAYFAGPVPTYTSANASHPDSLSYYFQENLGFWEDRIQLVGGLRWFTPGGYNENVLTNTTTKRFDKTFRTHKYGMLVHPLPSMSLYYTDVETIFPQTGFVDKYTAGDNLDPLKNQEGKLKEIGFKVDHKVNDKLTIYGSIAWYDMSLTNVRVAGGQLPDGTYGVIQSAGDSSDGMEYEFGGTLKFDQGAFNWIATYSDSDSAIASDSRIKAHDHVPQKYSFMGRYAWNSGPLSGLAVGATYFDQSRKRESVYYIDFPATYNVFARYAWNKNWSVQLNLNNLTDERYIVAIAATGLVQTEPGFDGKLAIKYKW